MNSRKPGELSRQDLLDAAIEDTLKYWTAGGETETTLSVTLFGNGQVRINLIGDRVVFPLLISELIEHAGKRMDNTSPNRFLYLINGFMELKGIVPEYEGDLENELTIKFREEKNDENV